MKKVIIAVLAVLCCVMAAFAEGQYRKFSEKKKLNGYSKEEYWGVKDSDGKVVIPAIYFDIVGPDDGVFFFKDEKTLKYGLMDLTGKVLLLPQFSDVNPFGEGLAFVRKEFTDDGYFIDTRGNRALSLPEGTKPCTYFNKFSDGRFPIYIESGYKRRGGYMDADGNIVIKPKYESAYPFTNGYAEVKRNGKYGVIDVNGNEVVPCVFKAVEFSVSWPKAVKWHDKEKHKMLDGFVAADGRLFKSKKDAIAGVNPILDEMSKLAQGQTPTKKGPTLKEFLASKNFKPWPEYIARYSATAPKAPTVEERKRKVEAAVNQWQQKGEFESVAEWKARVTEASRLEYARQADVEIIAEFKKQQEHYNELIGFCRQDYEKEYNELTAEFFSKKADEFNVLFRELKPYDAENETFLISIDTFGDILLPVPKAEAPAFKEKFQSLTPKPVFVPSGDDVALQSVAFGKYVYDSNTKGDYAMVNVDYNFTPVDLTAEINYDFDALPDGGAAMASAATTVSVSGQAPAPVQPRNITPETHKITAGNGSDVDRDIPQTDAEAANTFAVIIANGDYQNASKVKFAVNDGKIMAEYFHRTLGIPAKQIYTFHDATAGQMGSAMSRLRQVARAYAGQPFNVIYYYVGHGFPDEKSKKSYLLPTDVDPSNTQYCVALEDLYRELSELGASQVTVMLDACFSGTDRADAMLVPTALGVRLKARDTTAPTGNMIVMSAAQSDQTAYPYEAKGHDLFTYYVLKHLQSTKGKCSLGDLADYVITNVRKTSVVENARLQEPSVAASPSFTSWKESRMAR